VGGSPTIRESQANKLPEVADSISTFNNVSGNQTNIRVDNTPPPSVHPVTALLPIATFLLVVVVGLVLVVTGLALVVVALALAIIALVLVAVGLLYPVSMNPTV
jgi:hypothetical protein